MANKYFSRYLSVAPFSLSLWRAMEAQKIAEALNKVSKISTKNEILQLPKPALDLGCGFGEFAGVFFDRQVEVGIDISIEDLVKAKKVNKHKNLFIADARKLPFPDNTFSTIISVSVLEHIQRVQLALKEAFRVLKPGGLFILTIPTEELNNNLFYPEIFRKIGWKQARSFYLQKYHKVFKHVNILPPKSWQSMLTKCGFNIIYYQGIFFRALTQIFDITLISALPSQISRWLFGDRWIWGLSIKERILSGLFDRLLREDKQTESNVLIIAKK